MWEISEISNALEVTVKDGELQNVTLEIAEGLTDSLLDEGLLKDIPLLGGIYGIYKASISISDKLLLRKLLQFLIALKDIPKSQRHKQIEKIQNSEKYRAKVGEKLLFIIDKCDDTQKAKLIGELFKSYLKEEMDYEDFQRAVVCIDRSNMPDLKLFLDSNFVETTLEDLGSEYVASGLMELVLPTPTIRVDKTSNDIKGSGDPDYVIENFVLHCQISDIGKIIRKILFTVR